MAKPVIAVCELLTSYEGQSQRIGRFACSLTAVDYQGSFYMNSVLFYGGRSGTGGSLPPKPGASDNPLIVDLTEKAIALKPSPANVFRCNDSTTPDYREKSDLALQGILLYLDALPAQGSAVTAANLVFKFDYYIAGGQRIQLAANFEDGITAVAGPFDGGAETMGATLTIPIALGQTRKLLSFTLTNEAVIPSPPSADLFLMTQGPDGTRRVQPTNTWTLPVPVSFTRVDPTSLPSGLVAFLSTKTAPSGYASLGAESSVSAFQATFAAITSNPPAGRVGIGSSSICLGGNLYVSGGMVGGVPTTGFLRYDIDGTTWDDTLAQMPEPRAYHRMLVVGGKILCVHGLAGPSGMAQYTLVYDPATGVWSKSSHAYNYHRYDAAIAELNGVVYCFGGLNIKGTTTEIQNQCSSINMSGGGDPIEVNLTIPNDNFKRRYGAAAVAVGDAVYIIGGKDSPPAGAPSGVHGAAHGTGHASLAGDPGGAHRANLLGFGAFAASTGSSVDAFSPLTNRYQRAAALAHERMHHAACAAGDLVYILGGEDMDGALMAANQCEALSLSRLPGRAAAITPVAGMLPFRRGTAAMDEGVAYITGGGDAGDALVAPGSIHLGITLYAMRRV